MSEHLDCQSLLGDLNDYMDGTAQKQVCEEIERHMRECSDCRVFVDTLKKSILLYQQQESQIEFPASSRERLFKKLDLEDLLGAP